MLCPQLAVLLEEGFLRSFIIITVIDLLICIQVSEDRLEINSPIKANN